MSLIPKDRKRRGRSASAEGGAGKVLLRELERQSDEICIVMRIADLYPVYVSGDIEAMLGVTQQQLRDDITCILSVLKVPKDGSEYWNEYRKWNGEDKLSTDLETVSGTWIGVSVRRSIDGIHDLFFFRVRTEEHKREEQYQESLRRVETASQFKTSFLFRMSHEIRTPMNGISGMLTLAEAKLPEEHPAMQYLTKAEELSGHLLSLINDILDMSRIEAGKLELEKRAFSIRGFGKKLLDMFEKTLEAKGVDYSVEYEELTVDWVVGDELRLGQVIINFLSNAVKFTSQGEVIVTFRQMFLKDGKADLMIRVHDTGIGMKPEFISRIFHPFEQEDASTTRKFDGTGLGMAISDQLVKLMGGQIVVDSMPGKGSDFTVFISLPVAESGDAVAEIETGRERKTVAKDIRRPCRILMDEDNEINAMIAVEILTQKGAAVDVADNGQSVVERFLDMPENYYSVILMDIQMPVMDGRAAARAIRALDRPDAATVPIFALSADAFVEDERLSKESGMNGHLAKPIDFDNLWRTVQDTMQWGDEYEK